MRRKDQKDQSAVEMTQRSTDTVTVTENSAETIAAERTVAELKSKVNGYFDHLFKQCAEYADKLPKSASGNALKELLFRPPATLEDLQALKESIELAIKKNKALREEFSPYYETEKSEIQILIEKLKYTTLLKQILEGNELPPTKINQFESAINTIESNRYFSDHRNARDLTALPRSTKGEIMIDDSKKILGKYRKQEEKFKEDAKLTPNAVVEQLLSFNTEHLDVICENLVGFHHINDPFYGIERTDGGDAYTSDTRSICKEIKHAIDDAKNNSYEKIDKLISAYTEKRDGDRVGPKNKIDPEEAMIMEKLIETINLRKLLTASKPPEEIITEYNNIDPKKLKLAVHRNPKFDKFKDLTFNLPSNLYKLIKSGTFFRHTKGEQMIDRSKELIKRYQKKHSS